MVLLHLVIYLYVSSVLGLPSQAFVAGISFSKVVVLSLWLDTVDQSQVYGLARDLLDGAVKNSKVRAAVLLKGV